jgi:hypothetical protein
MVAKIGVGHDASVMEREGDRRDDSHQVHRALWYQISDCDLIDQIVAEASERLMRFAPTPGAKQAAYAEA